MTSRGKGGAVVTVACAGCLVGLGLCNGVPSQMDNLNRIILGAGVLCVAGVLLLVGLVMMLMNGDGQK